MQSRKRRFSPDMDQKCITEDSSTSINSTPPLVNGWHDAEQMQEAKRPQHLVAEALAHYFNTELSRVLGEQSNVDQKQTFVDQCMSTQKLIGCYNELLDLVCTKFRNQRLYRQALTDTFTRLLNESFIPWSKRHDVVWSKRLALYLHSLLRRPSSVDKAFMTTSVVSSQRLIHPHSYTAPPSTTVCTVNTTSLLATASSIVPTASSIVPTASSIVPTAPIVPTRSIVGTSSSVAAVVTNSAATMPGTSTAAITPAPVITLAAAVASSIVLADGPDEISINKGINDVVSVLKHIKDKDVFEYDTMNFYSARLLQGVSWSMEMEKCAIAKLQHVAWDSLIMRMNGMLKDLERSTILEAKYRLFCNSSTATAAATLEHSVLVGTTGYWPSRTLQPPLHLSSEISLVCDTYQKWYSSVHASHKLEWRFELGRADVEICFSDQCTRLCSVSTYQMIILLLFNRYKSCAYKDIKRCTGLSHSQLVAPLMSLVHAKIGILVKSPPSVDLTDACRFQLNPTFYSVPEKVFIVPTFQSVNPPHSTPRAVFLRNQVDIAIRKCAKHAYPQSITQESLVLLVQDRMFKLDIPVCYRLSSSSATLPSSSVTTASAPCGTENKPHVSTLTNGARIKASDVLLRIEAAITREELARDRNENNLYRYIP